jgi:CubicO group peptidase (beta-lactamase class C family)
MNRSFLNICVFIILILSLNSCGSIYRFLRYGPPQVTDHERFIKLPVEASQNPSKLLEAKVRASFPEPAEWVLDTKKRRSKKAKKYKTNEAFFEDSETISFLVIKNDSIIYEKYFNGYGPDMPAQVFSVTKSILGTLVAIAVRDGDIKGFDQPVSDFIPEFSDERSEIKLDHILQMTAGFDFNDLSIPGLRKLLHMYYIKNQGDYLHKVGLKQSPGQSFAYSSYASLVLGTCLEKAVGMPINEYLSQKLWKPMGAQYPAYWTAHKDSVAKMYGGIVTVARDLARFGSLFLNEGRMNGRQIVPRDWVLKTRQMDTLNGAWWGYNNSFWLNTYYEGCEKVKINYKKIDKVYMVKKQKNDFFAGGYKGQTVYLDPKNDIIVVRQGAKRSGFYWSTSISHLVHRVYDEGKKTKASIY